MLRFWPAAGAFKVRLGVPKVNVTGPVTVPPDASSAGSHVAVDPCRA
jgi:hypothetical protein